MNSKERQKKPKTLQQVLRYRKFIYFVFVFEHFEKKMNPRFMKRKQKNNHDFFFTFLLTHAIIIKSCTYFTH